MLTELHIKNFAIIDELSLDFDHSLVVFTGETGAGKSIILDALEAVLGGRAEVATIRTDTDRAIIEATFRLSPEIKTSVHALLEAEDLLDNLDFVTMAREIRLEGRNTSRVNGRVVTATLQREIGAFLVDIHGQSEHLSLLHTRSHLHLLDNFANVGLVLMGYRDVYQQLREVQKMLGHLRQNEQDKARRMDMLSYQIQEIESAKLEPGDETNLRQDRTRLANAESLANHSQNALMLIEDGTPDVPGISELFGEVQEALKNLSRIDPTTAALSERGDNALLLLQDLGLELQNYSEGIEFNPRLLNKVEERIDLINNLKRKYGNSIEEILAFCVRAREELTAITHAEEHIEALEEQEAQLLVKLTEKAQELSRMRHKAGEVLGQLVEIELNDLRMENATFEVAIDERQDINGLPISDGKRVAYNTNGYDRVEFLVETNPGEGLRSLVKTASGGETSRLMLALKNVLVKADQVPTLIFDEIDQGIGGRVGLMVGEKLWNLSQQHQVMCITHLPQLAGYAEQHFNVTKQLINGRTHTEVTSLEGNDRQKELAQMLGPVSEGTLQSAEDILKLVKERKSKLKSLR